MSDKDLIIASTSIIPNGSVIIQKPSYLIKIFSDNKKSKKMFVAIEQPKIETSYVQCKGFYYDGDEDSLYSKYNDIIANHSKSLQLEVWFPWHSIELIRSLVFRADKNKK